MHSTGPRTEQGKRRSAVNALRHGLSVTGRSAQDDPQNEAIAECIGKEGIEHGLALELAQRIVAYERNLEHQRELLLQSFPSLAGQEAESAEKATRILFGAELDMLDDIVADRQFFDGGVTTRDLKFVARMKLKMGKLGAQQLRLQERAKAQDAQNSIRYLKRSSNQLIKALKGLKTPL